MSLATVTQATTYYISPSGNDDHSGTSPSKPWRTTQNANGINFTSGDEILFLANVDHACGTLSIRTQNITNGIPVIISSYGGTSGQRARLHSDATISAGVIVFSSSGVDISNLDLIGTNTFQSKQSGVLLYGDTNETGSRFNSISIHDLSVTGFNMGVYIYSPYCRGYSGVRVSNVLVQNNLMNGIASDGAMSPSCYSHSDIVIEDSIAFNNTGDPTFLSSNSGSGIVLSDVDGAVITRCQASYNGALNGHLGGGPCGIWAWGSRNVTISHSVSNNNFNGFPPGTPNAQDGDGFDLDGGSSDSVIEYCLSMNNAGPGYLICQFSGSARETFNNTVRFSVSYNDGLSVDEPSAGLNFYTPGPPLNSMQIQGNTFVVKNEKTIVRPMTGGDLANLQLVNNAFLSLGGEGTTIDFSSLTLGQASNVNVSGNAYWSSKEGTMRIIWAGGNSYSSLSAFRAATGEEETKSGVPTGSDSDPQLVNGTNWFASCLPWLQSSFLPDIPNSAILDELRGFSGCE
jgi:hypothetical protein